MTHWIKVTSIWPVGEYLLDRGVNPARFLRDIELPPSVLLGRDLWVKRETGLHMSNMVSIATGDSLAGMHFAETVDLQAYGLWSAMLLESRDVGEILRRSANHINLLETSRVFSIAVEADRVRLSVRFGGTLRASPREYIDASLVLISRFLSLAVENVSREVCLPYERPTDTTEIERLLGPDLVFGAEAAAIVVDRDALAIPLDKNKVGLELSSTPGASALHSRVAADVAMALPRLLDFGRPTAACVADALSMNQRTMQRHLAAWGTSFEQLRHEVLMRRAIIDLRESCKSVTDIAFDLGYSDSAHFTRAFKRWVGCSPRRFRSEEIESPMMISALLLANHGGSEHPPAKR